MKKISNKEEADNYYQIINDHIDDYIKKWKVNPVNLKKYFSKKNKVKNFLNRVGLFDVERIESILNDVIEDREAMIKDKIIKFENFQIKESFNFSDTTENYEKVLADFFHTSLSHVEVTEKKKHKYKIDDMGEPVEASIFSEDDMQDFKKQLKQLLIDETKETDVDFYQIRLGEQDLKTKLSFVLNDIIDESKFDSKIEEVLVENKLIEVLSNWLNDYDLLRSRKKFTFNKKFHNHFIWILEKK